VKVTCRTVKIPFCYHNLVGNVNWYDSFALRVVLCDKRVRVAHRLNFDFIWRGWLCETGQLKKAAMNPKIEKDDKIDKNNMTPRWWVKVPYKWLAHIFAGRKLGSETGQLRLAPLLPLAYMKIVNQTKKYKNQSIYLLFFRLFQLVLTLIYPNAQFERSGKSETRGQVYPLGIQVCTTGQRVLHRPRCGHPQCPIVRILSLFK